MVVVAVDVGGTFTDFVILRDDGTIYSTKILSTPRSPEVAVFDGLRRIRGHISEVLHATTIGTNTLGVRIGLGYMTCSSISQGHWFQGSLGLRLMKES